MTILSTFPDRKTALERAFKMILSDKRRCRKFTIVIAGKRGAYTPWVITDAPKRRKI